jgi:hypothetical protein
MARRRWSGLSSPSCKKYGLTIWFDELTLRVGNSLRVSIEARLAQSRFGVVIFSHAFFSKNWAQAELNALFAREMQGKSDSARMAWIDM